MSDTVTTKLVYENNRRIVIHMTNLSDGTGESSVRKVVKADYLGPNLKVPGHFVVEKIMYDVASMRVHLQWDRAPAETIAVLQGWGTLNFSKRGAGMHEVNTGATGDILLTTANQASGDGYDITLYLRKKD